MRHPPPHTHTPRACASRATAGGIPCTRTIHTYQVKLGRWWWAEIGEEIAPAGPSHLAARHVVGLAQLARLARCSIGAAGHVPPQVLAPVAVLGRRVCVRGGRCVVRHARRTDRRGGERTSAPPGWRRGATAHQHRRRALPPSHLPSPRPRGGVERAGPAPSLLLCASLPGGPDPTDKHLLLALRPPARGRGRGPTNDARCAPRRRPPWAGEAAAAVSARRDARDGRSARLRSDYWQAGAWRGAVCAADVCRGTVRESATSAWTSACARECPAAEGHRSGVEWSAQGGRLTACFATRTSRFCTGGEAVCALDGNGRRDEGGTAICVGDCGCVLC